MKKEGSRFFVTLALILLVIIIFIIATKSYLTLRLLLGNDLIISLNSDNENLFLSHNQKGNVTFSMFATTNPFCKIDCISDFADLSGNKTIEKSYFNMTPTKFESKTYELAAEKLGEGQELYRFNVECRSIKTILCQTAEEPKKRSILVTLNYNMTPEEQKFESDAKEKIISLMQRADYLKYYSNMLASAVYDADEINFNADAKINSINQKIPGYINTGNYLKMLWENRDYMILGKEMTENSIEKNITGTEDELKEINRTVFSGISNYNAIAKNLDSIKQTLEGFKKINVTNSTFDDINKAIIDFNALLISFSKKSSLSEKQVLIDKMANETKTISAKIESESGSLCCFANETINNASIGLNITLLTYAPKTIIFKEPSKTCCMLGKCQDCCDDNCQNKDYPVILLHGHDFNKAVSAEHSLNAFQKIQDALETDYLDAGSIIISDETQYDVWGRMNSPVTVKASYYFDIYKSTGKGRVIETKTDSIDTYALRLKDIISLMKHKTNKDKVTIIAHSMGGLVARRYIQIFGDNDINKLVMIATPNSGIDENILKYCSVLGAGLECRDMDKNSLFINKLGSSGTSQMYNIIGIGCQMDNETGDGIVKKSSAYMENAMNYYVNGTCTGFSYLHENLLNTEEYPQVYGILKEILRKSA